MKTLAETALENIPIPRTFAEGLDARGNADALLALNQPGVLAPTSIEGVSIMVFADGSGFLFERGFIPDDIDPSRSMFSNDTALADALDWIEADLNLATKGLRANFADQPSLKDWIVRSNGQKSRYQENAQALVDNFDDPLTGQMKKWFNWTEDQASELSAMLTDVLKSGPQTGLLAARLQASDDEAAFITCHDENYNPCEGIETRAEIMMNLLFDLSSLEGGDWNHAAGPQTRESSYESSYAEVCTVMISAASNHERLIAEGRIRERLMSRNIEDIDRFFNEKTQGDIPYAL